MKIVVLDGFTLNPGDLSWEGLYALGDVEVYERTSPEDVIQRAQGAAVVLTNKVLLTAEVMERLPELRYVGVLATGYNVVDLEYARSHGIVVTNIPAYSTMSVAQMVFAHILNITNSVSQYAARVRDGEWQRSRDFCLCDTNLTELDGKVMGILGLGNIGMAVARIAMAMGMRVLVMSSKGAEELRVMGMEKASGYEELFAESDVLSLHCPLTDETRHVVNAEHLSLMKRTAIVINTGRGPLVDEAALAEALCEGRIAAAGVDVLTEEPPRAGSPLISAPNCFITPHIAWASRAARTRLMDIAVENVSAFFSGVPQNVV